MEDRRLYRSEQNRMIGGVCAGLGDYLGVDATVVRVVFVLLGLLNGLGVLLYLAMWVIVPSQSQVGQPPGEVARGGVRDMRERAREGAQKAREAVRRSRASEPEEGRRDEPRREEPPADEERP